MKRKLSITARQNKRADGKKNSKPNTMVQGSIWQGQRALVPFYYVIRLVFTFLELHHTMAAYMIF